MENKKSPLPDNVIRAMRRDDGYIQMKYTGHGVQYEVYVLTTDGYKSICTVSDPLMKALYSEGYVEHLGDGKWKLTDKGKEKD